MDFTHGRDSNTNSAKEKDYYEKEEKLHKSVSLEE